MKALLLLDLLDMYKSKPMRVNMKEPVELEPMKKVDEIRRILNKKLRLTKESIGAMPPANIADRSGRNRTVTYLDS